MGGMVIEIQELTKSYKRGGIPALDALSLQIEAGEIFGYLGPNGAGKTTTIRLMLDFIRPTKGHVQIFGLDVRQHSQTVRAQMGFLPGELSLWDHMTGEQTLDYLVTLRPGCDLDYAHSLARRLKLDLSRRAGSYSTGNKRKLGIIQAMMHRPPLLILDEPTTGLDPLMRHTFNDLLREAKAYGQTVFLSSHVLSEVQAVCDRVAILRHGRLRRVARMSEIQATLARVVTIFSADVPDDDRWLEVENVYEVRQGPGFVRLHVHGSLDAVIKYAAAYQIDDLRVETAGLEQVFMDFYHD